MNEEEAEVHLWCAKPGELRARGRMEAAQRLLTLDERARLERYHFDHDRNLYLATRVLVRTVLSRYEPVAPAAWRFAANAHGRPAISVGCAGAGRLHFNLSNTNGLVVCAVATATEVGVDVEHLGKTAPLEVASRYFAPTELAALAALEPLQRERRFFEYWTLKESYIKARGLGLALPLDRFAFSLNDDLPPSIKIDPMLADCGCAWQFVQRLPTPDHLLALCIKRRDGRDADVVLRWHSLAESL